ncbi:MAG: hypothetical protein LBO72_07200 [Helicobacteraceae bacterium]|nr:hypothetical protein [Helicobacteraceae bacterium]
MQTSIAPNAALDCRDLPLSRSLYPKLENALLLLNKDEILDLRTDRANFESWRRFKGHTSQIDSQSPFLSFPHSARISARRKVRRESKNPPARSHFVHRLPFPVIPAKCWKSWILL